MRLASTLAVFVNLIVLLYRSGYWGYNNGYGKEDNLAAYKETLSGGISFIDTAEVQPSCL